MEGIRRFLNAIESVNEYLGRAISWVTFGLVLVVFTDVIMRYLFRTSFVFVQELEWHLFSVIFLLGAGYALLHDEHVRVDIFYQRMSLKGKAWVNLLGCLLGLFPGCILIIMTGVPFAMDSYAVMEGSPDPGGIPLRFIIKGMIVVGFIFVALQGISLTIKSLLTILDIELELEGFDKPGKTAVAEEG